MNYLVSFAAVEMIVTLHAQNVCQNEIKPSFTVKNAVLYMWNHLSNLVHKIATLMKYPMTQKREGNHIHLSFRVRKRDLKTWIIFIRKIIILKIFWQNSESDEKNSSRRNYIWRSSNLCWTFKIIETYLLGVFEWGMSYVLYYILCNSGKNDKKFE